MFRSHRRAIVLASSALLLGSLAACEKKPLAPAPDGVEGRTSTSQLVVYPDVPIQVHVFTVGKLEDCPDDDVLLRTDDVYAEAAGVVHGMIVDFSPAGAYQIFREQSTQFVPLQDFQIQPVKRYPTFQTDLFTFSDARPQPTLQAYLGRGLIGGSATASSPRTNVAQVTGTVASDLDYTGPTGLCPDFRSPPDSLLQMSWAPVAGAAGYWVHVYRFTDQDNTERVLSGLPAPIYHGVTIDYFLAYFPGTVTSYHLGDPRPNGTLVVEDAIGVPPYPRSTMINELEYNVRVSAVDANGQLIAYTGESETIESFPGDWRNIIEGDTLYTSFPLGAAKVRPQHIFKAQRIVTCAPSGCPPPPIPTSIQGLPIHPARSTQSIWRR